MQVSYVMRPNYYVNGPLEDSTWEGKLTRKAWQFERRDDTGRWIQIESWSSEMLRLLTVAGGVALILFGVRHLRKGLDRLFGDRLGDWLRRLSGDRVKGDSP
jgi:hypothetical protein